MAEEAPKRKINFTKIALFGLGPIVLLGIGVGAGAFLFMPTQTPVEQVEELIEKKLKPITKTSDAAPITSFTFANLAVAAALSEAAKAFSMSCSGHQ